jgi:hypothetical protein
MSQGKQLNRFLYESFPSWQLYISIKISNHKWYTTWEELGKETKVFNSDDRKAFLFQIVDSIYYKVSKNFCKSSTALKVLSNAKAFAERSINR